MPRLPTDYSNTIIYKIVCKDLSITDLYVGNTTDFRKRKNIHKNNTINKSHLKIYVNINENGGWDNWDMIEIEKYPCIDANEARARQRYWYEELNASLNMRKPIIIDKVEYYTYYTLKNNTEDRKKYMKEYCSNLTEEQKQKNIIWRTTTYNCICGSIIRNDDKARHFRTEKHNKFIESIRG